MNPEKLKLLQAQVRIGGKVSNSCNTCIITIIWLHYTQVAVLQIEFGIVIVINLR